LLFRVLYLQYGTVLRLSYMYILPNTTYCRNVGRLEQENEFFSVHLISCILYKSCSERQGLLRRQKFGNLRTIANMVGIIRKFF
jgi:hypothetical protein